MNIARAIGRGLQAIGSVIISGAKNLGSLLSRGVEALGGAKPQASQLGRPLQTGNKPILGRAVDNVEVDRETLFADLELFASGIGRGVIEQWVKDQPLPQQGTVSNRGKGPISEHVSTLRIEGQKHKENATHIFKGLAGNNKLQDFVDKRLTPKINASMEQISKEMKLGYTPNSGHIKLFVDLTILMNSSYRNNISQETQNNLMNQLANLSAMEGKRDIPANERVYNRLFFSVNVTQ